MVGGPLSRWTFGYFACALVCLIGGLGLIAAGYGIPADMRPATLVVVHLVAIGWLSLLMIGALLQFVPVLTAKPLHYEWAAALGLGLLLVGLAFLILGFLALDYAVLPLAALPTGGALLAGGFACAMTPIATNLWSARPLTLPARFVVVGLVCLAGAAALGASFTAMLWGLLPGAGLTDAVPFHAGLALGGWIGFTAMGVSYRLMGMFLLAPDEGGPMARILLALGAAAAIVAGIGGAMAAAGRPPAWVELAAGTIALAGAALYAGDALVIYRRRRRRRMELNMTATIGALAGLVALCLLALGLMLTGRVAQHLDALVYLACFGWLTGLGLAQLYKIVPFLTWLETYAPIMGRRPTPRVQDLVRETLAAPWFGAYFAATGLASIMLLVGATGPFRALAAVQGVSVIAIAAHLWRSRRLTNIAITERIGIATPRLLLPTTRTRSPR